MVSGVTPISAIPVPVLNNGAKRIRSDIERRRLRCDTLEEKFLQLIKMVEVYSKVDMKLASPFFGNTLNLF